MAQRSVTDKSNMASVLTTGSSGEQKRSSLHEAYKKHANELVSIEDRLRNVLLVILGVFAVGVKELSSLHGHLSQQVAFSVLVAAIAGFGIHLNLEYRNLRIAVRDLLVRCEIALGFYEKNAFIADDTLYTADELTYPNSDKGKYLLFTNLAVIGASAVGLIVLIWH
jgi:hypothetical protein